MIEYTVVVLPIPLRPSREVISPAPTSRFDPEEHLAPPVGGGESPHLEQGIRPSESAHRVRLPRTLRASGVGKVLAEVCAAHLGGRPGSLPAGPKRPPVR